eukprot:gene12795-7067_t
MSDMFNSGKKSEKIEVEEQGALMQEELNEDLLGSDTEKIKNKRQIERKVKNIKKKAGLLDEPANYLDIGILKYYSSKRKQNLENYDASIIQKSALLDKLDETGNNTFKKSYDGYNKLKLEDKDVEIPKDASKKIAFYDLSTKIESEKDIINLLYPFIDLGK